jgi:peptide/nickel transport system substrate-binding protein
MGFFRYRWVCFVGGFLVCCLLALSSCQPQGGRSAGPLASQSVSQAGNQLRNQLIVASPSDPATFNPSLNESLYSVFGYLFEGLLKTNGETGDLEPGMAEKWEISPDKKKVVFTLRPGLKWSDGQPLTAADVVFTFRDIYLNPDVPSGTQDVLKIGASEKFPAVRQIGDRQVEFTTPEPFAPFIRVCGGLSILPQHILGPTLKAKDSKGNLKYLSTWGTDSDPRLVVGNGPYTMVEYTPSQRVVFQRNPHYWEKGSQGEVLPKIERIVSQIIESDANQLIRFRSGELDELNVKPEMFSLLKREEDRVGFKVLNGGPEAGTRSISFNLNKALDAKGKPVVDPVHSRWFHEVKFRQAVAYAIDRERIRDNTYRGLAQLLNSPIWSITPFFLKPEEGLKVYNHDPQKARQLLQEAGFTYKNGDQDKNGDENKNSGELFDAQGNRVTFTILVKAEEKSRVDMTVQIAEDLKAIGIQANTQVVSFNTVLQRLTNRTWDCYVGGFGGGGLDPNSGANIWLSHGSLHQFNQGPKAGDPPLKGWEVSSWEKEIDRLFAAGAQELDEKKRKVIYGQFQKIVQEQLPFIHLINELNLEAVRNRVKGLRFSAIGGAFWNLPELTVLD